MFDKYNQDNIDNESNDSYESIDSDSDDELYDIYKSNNVEQSGGKKDDNIFKTDGFFNKNVDGINNMGINFWELISVSLLIIVLLLIFLNNNKWNEIGFINKLYIIGSLLFWGCVSCANIIISILNEKYIIEGVNFFKIEKYQMVLLILITICTIFGIIQYFNPEMNLWISNPYMYALFIVVIEGIRIILSYFIYVMPNVEIQKNKILGEDSIPDMKYNGLYLLYCILFLITYGIIYFIPNGLKNYNTNSYCYQEPIIYLIILIIANIFNDKNGNILSYLLITLGAIIYRINVGYEESTDDQLKDIEIPDQEVLYTTDHLQRMERIKQMEKDGDIDFSSIYEEAKKPTQIQQSQKKQEQEKDIKETSELIETLDSDSDKSELQKDYTEIINLNKELDQTITDKMDNLQNEINDIQDSIKTSDTESYQSNSLDSGTLESINTETDETPKK